MTFSVAVFPFLKTSSPVRIGPYEFRSTLDIDGLPKEQATAIREIREMLFVKDELRVVSASHAITPAIEKNRPGEELDRLIRLRAVVVYLYSQPHEVFDGIFLSPEECSLHLLTPARVSEFLVWPGHHTSPARPLRRAKSDPVHTVRGYEGLFNLGRAFWVAPRSRVYPPLPQITLNIYQDLAADVAHALPGTRSLLTLLADSQAGLSQRVLTAVSWYNFANEELAGPDRALLNLAVAFEALLLLPEDAKSDRFVDAVALLLGRTERIDVWARQFYSARSRVAHEGRARDLHLYPSELARKQGSLDGRAAPLMFYGRQIFRLCLSTILAGGEFAREGDLKQKFVTHSERLTAICRTAADRASSSEEKLKQLAPHIAALKRYQYLESGAIGLPELIGAVRAVSSVVLKVETPSALRAHIEPCAAAKGDQTELEQLEALKSLADRFKETAGELPPSLRLLHELVDVVWMMTFPNYFSLQREAESKGL